LHKNLSNSLTAAVLLLVALSVIAVACGGDDDSGPAAPATAQPAVETPTTPPTAAPVATDVPPSVYPMTLTGGDGIEVTIEAKPQAVVALLPSITNMVADLQLVSAVVGTDQFTLVEHPDAFAGVANVGGSLFEFDLEAIAALEPDLVIVGDLGQNDLPSQLRTLGITVLVIGFPATVEEMLEQMITVGAVFGDPQGAEIVVADLRNRLDDVAASVTQGDPVTVYMELDQSDAAAPYAVGPGGLHHEAIILAGGENIFADAESSFPQVNQETIIDRNPQVVILLDSVEFAAENAFAPISIPDAKARVGWNSISAVQNDNVYAVNGSDIATGIRLIEGIERLAEIFAEAREKLTYVPGAVDMAA